MIQELPFIDRNIWYKYRNEFENESMALYNLSTPISNQKTNELPNSQSFLPKMALI